MRARQPYNFAALAAAPKKRVVNKDLTGRIPDRNRISLHEPLEADQHQKPTDTEIDLSQMGFFEDVHKALRGNISFGYAIQGGISSDNLDGVWAVAVVTPGVVDTEFAVTHNLLRVPIGFDVKRTDKACSIYDSGTPWTDKIMYLKCNVVTATITLFIH